MTWVWIVGALVLVAAAVLPVMLARRSAERREYVAARDAAHSSMSRLEWALDQPGADPDALTEARRCYTLAGSALAGTDTTDGLRQAEAWARQGLSALGVSDPDREHDGSPGGERGGSPDREHGGEHGSAEAAGPER